MITFLPHIFIIFSAFAGILLASYIRYKKTVQEVLVCPLGSSCEAVTHSEFSRFFGIPVELLGIAYYTVVALSYAVFVLFPALATTQAVFLITSLSVAAFMFSLYLTFIQAFTLRQWCTWCLTSAGLCTVIAATVLFGTEHQFTDIFAQNYRLLLALHLAGLALGLGGATITDLFFFKFLKDFRISHDEKAIMHTLSQVIWVGIAVLVLSGIGLYLGNAHTLNHSSKFLVKVIVVGVIITNGAFLNLLISPKLVRIAFRRQHHHDKGELHHLRRIAFALGAISATSWYTAFGLGIARNIPLSFSTLLLLYICLLAGAVTTSQLLDYMISRPQATTSRRSATVPT